MAQDILAHQVPFFQVMRLLFYSLPAIIALSAPFASLMGTLMTVGRLSSDNEILIMLTSGFSYRIVFLPALAVGVLISLISFVANDVLLPAGSIRLARLYRSIVLSTPALELAENSVKRFRDTTIVTGPVEGTTIRNILILDRTGDGERRLIMAQNAALLDGGREGLSLELTGAFIQSSREIARYDYDYASADLLRYWVPQEDLIQAITTIGPNQMSSTDLRREIRIQSRDIQYRLQEQYRTYLAQALTLEEALRKGPTHSSWHRRERYFDDFSRELFITNAMRNDRRLQLFRLEYNKKFSIPFGAMSFVFLAVSLGLMAKKSGQVVGFLFGAIISFIFWAMMMVGQTVAMRLGYSPFWSMWMPNFLALGVGTLLLLIRMRR